MEKYLVLKFENAKLFLNKKTKDYCLNQYYDTKSNRGKSLVFDSPITKYQISNVLHVLFGERPVPTFRKVVYNMNEKYMKMAESGYLKINNLRILDKNKNKKFFGETLQTKKTVYNSWNTGNTILHWDKIKEFYYNNKNNNYFLFDEFVKLLNEIFDKENILNESFESVLNNIWELYKNEVNFYGNGNIDWNNSKLKKIYDFNKNNKKATINFLFFKNEENKKTTINSYYSSLKVVRNTNMGIENNVVKLFGEIIIPISENDLNNIQFTCANILDGGVVYISEIKEIYNVNLYGYNKINNINIKKINYADKNYS